MSVVLPVLSTPEAGVPLFVTDVPPVFSVPLVRTSVPLGTVGPWLTERVPVLMVTVPAELDAGAIVPRGKTTLARGVVLVSVTVLVKGVGTEEAG